MADDRTPAQRSETMRRIKSRGTTCERAVGAELRRRGHRFSRRKLPGSPDFAILAPSGARHIGVAVFVDGCFWHGCPHHCRMPTTNRGYWTRKIARNVARDAEADAALRALGWKPLRIWEHSVRESAPRCAARVERALGRPPVPARS